MDIKPKTNNDAKIEQLQRKLAKNEEESDAIRTEIAILKSLDESSSSNLASAYNYEGSKFKENNSSRVQPSSANSFNGSANFEENNSSRAHTSSVTTFSGGSGGVKCNGPPILHNTHHNGYLERNNYSPQLQTNPPSGKKKKDGWFPWLSSSTKQEEVKRNEQQQLEQLKRETEAEVRRIRLEGEANLKAIQKANQEKQRQIELEARQRQKKRQEEMEEQRMKMENEEKRRQEDMHKLEQHTQKELEKQGDEVKRKVEELQEHRRKLKEMEEKRKKELEEEAKERKVKLHNFIQHAQNYESHDKIFDEWRSQPD